MNAASSLLNRVVGTAASLVGSSTQNILSAYHSGLAGNQTQIMIGPNCPLNAQVNIFGLTKNGQNFRTEKQSRNAME
jgi:hypothetical protein